MRDGQFEARGGPVMLDRMLGIFTAWARSVQPSAAEPGGAADSQPRCPYSVSPVRLDAVESGVTAGLIALLAAFESRQAANTRAGEGT